MFIKKLLVGAIALAAPWLMLAPQAHAHGTVILEGSDAIGYHCTQYGTPGACTYENQVWSAIGGASSLPIAVIGDVSGVSSSTHPVVDFSSVAAAGNLNNYVALYFVAYGGCCSENDSLITAAGAASAVSAYLNGGGTVMIENYTGGSAWDFAVGTIGGANSEVAGVGGGAAGSTCTDGETVTAAGTTNGFTQPPPISCWTHQAYNQNFFGALGFTESYFNADPAYALDNPGTGAWSSLLANGNTVTGGGNGPPGVPEPASLALFAAGLLGLGMSRMRRRQHNS